MSILELSEALYTLFMTSNVGGTNYDAKHNCERWRNARGESWRQLAGRRSAVGVATKDAVSTVRVLKMVGLVSTAPQEELDNV